MNGSGLAPPTSAMGSASADRDAAGGADPSSANASANPIPDAATQHGGGQPAQHASSDPQNVAAQSRPPGLDARRDDFGGGELDLGAAAAAAAEMASHIAFGANRAARKPAAFGSGGSARFSHHNIYSRPRKPDGGGPFPDVSQDEDANRFAGAKRKPSAGSMGAMRPAKYQKGEHEQMYGRSDDSFGGGGGGGGEANGAEDGADGRPTPRGGAGRTESKRRDESDPTAWGFDMHENACSYNQNAMMNWAQTAMGEIESSLEEMKKDVLAAYTERVNKFFESLTDSLHHVYGQKWQRSLMRLKTEAEEGNKLRQHIQMARNALYGPGQGGGAGGGRK